MAHFHFFSRKRFAAWPDLGHLTEADLAKEQKRLRNGIDVWIVQSYILLAESLKARGHQVSIGNDVPCDAIVIAHRDDLNSFFGGLHKTFLVGVRADRASVDVANVELHQNGTMLDSRSFFLPLWPQPGLLPRDETRGDRMEQIAYFGRADSLPRWLSEAGFKDALRKLGMQFEIRSKDWHDYRNVDLVLAHRIEAPTMLQYKPATKLYNAWLAGVPALVSGEPAYLEQKCSDLDFLQIDTADDVLAAITCLQTQPELYEAMRAHSRKRAEAFTTEAVRRRWLAWLEDSILPAYAEWIASGASRQSWLNFSVRLMRQKAAARSFRQQIERELTALNFTPIRQAPPT